ncbi:MAG: extracellular solute-binding protein family 5 [Bacillales bacterium]|jgi:oligopeptide transport system substrate-binding protein|nr:extracellular solute-binding protein family 5 [Bacillales bacterium]
MKKITLFASAILLIAGVMSGCNSDKAADKKEKKEEVKQVLNLTATSEIPSMDSTLATDNVSFLVMDNTMEGLYRLDKDNKPTEGIAKSYDVSEDKKKYTFHLRDAKWSNGDPVTAHDFVFAWQRAVNPKTAAEYAFILFDIKNAAEINNGKLPVDQLGVKALDEKTLEVELANAIPYFLELTTFGTYYPLNEKFVTSQGSKHGVEADSALYNGPFVLKEWKHEESFKLAKNPNYWDKDTVKLEEINFAIVKDVATAVNLYDTDQVDRVILNAEYVDKYKDNKEFGTLLDSRLFFIRYNQKNKLFANEKVRKAIDLAYNKEDIADVILNDGSQPAYSLVPKNFVKGPDGKDFRDINGDLNKGSVDEAKKLWAEAKKELGITTIKVEMLNYDNDSAKRIGEFIKEELEKNLEGIEVNIKQQPFAQKLDLEKNLDYEFSFSGWGPDYPDPMTFVDMFITDSDFNEMAYSNKKYDELVAKAKGELLVDPQARWDAMAEAEKVLFEDMAISPVYQRGIAFVQKEYVRDVHKHNFGGDYSFKWAYIEK